MGAVHGKCSECGHVWPVAYLPMDVVKFATLAKRAACPKCAGTSVKVASVGRPSTEGAAQPGEIECK